MTRKKRKRKLRRHRCGGKIDFLRNLAKTMKSNRRRTSMVPGGGPLFQRMYTAGLRWTATALSRGVLSLFEPGADDPAARGSCLRAVLGPLAASAACSAGRRGRTVIGAR